MITEMWTLDCMAIFSDRKNSEDENIIIGIASIDNSAQQWNRQYFKIEIMSVIKPDEIELCKKVAMEFIQSKYWS